VFLCKKYKPCEKKQDSNEEKKDRADKYKVGEKEEKPA
jgi:hypothetical protein